MEIKFYLSMANGVRIFKVTKNCNWIVIFSLKIYFYVELVGKFQEMTLQRGWANKMLNLKCFVVCRADYCTGASVAWQVMVLCAD